MADAISLKKQSSDWLKNATRVAGGGIKANKNSGWLISWIRNVSEYAVLTQCLGIRYKNKLREISLRIFNGKQNWRRGEFGKRNYFSFEKQRGKDGKRDVGWLNTCKMFDLKWIDTQKNCNSYISQNINIVYSELNCKILMQKFHHPFFPFKHDRPK